MRLTSILTTEGIPSMPHHIEDGDNVAASLVLLRQTVNLEVYVREVIQVVSTVLILTIKELRQMCIWWGMRARKFKIWMNKWSCYLEVISRKVRAYPELCNPNRTACNRNRSFPRKRKWWDTVSKFHCKSIQRTPSKVIRGYYSWSANIESFVTTANFSALDIH